VGEAVEDGEGGHSSAGLEAGDRGLGHAGFPDELSVHCLRHSYVSHLIEDGVDPLFVQQQVGHSWASTTATYTTIGADARNRMLKAALARVWDEGRHHRR